LSFADGKNSYLDICNAVSAEALAAGEHYYGAATREMIEEFLTSVLSAGIIQLKEGRREIK
jgi:hypothetical protein